MPVYKLFWATGDKYGGNLLVGFELPSSLFPPFPCFHCACEPHEPASLWNSDKSSCTHCFHTYCLPGCRGKYFPAQPVRPGTPYPHTLGKLAPLAWRNQGRRRVCKESFCRISRSVSGICRNSGSSGSWPSSQPGSPCGPSQVQEREPGYSYLSLWK